MTLAGLLLAAGEGRRMGRPKALLTGPDRTPLIDRAVWVLYDGGCDTVTVVVGAQADDVLELLDRHGWPDRPGFSTVVNQSWAEGMGTSLNEGLRAMGSHADAAVVHLVDLPDVGADVVARLTRPAGSGTLARASYAGRPGHPVVIGREHWSGVIASAQGDQGARDYLDSHGTVLVPCDDLATGRDVDRPEDLAR